MGLIAGGYAYLAGPNIITLILVAGFICLILVACSQLILQP